MNTKKLFIANSLIAILPSCHFNKLKTRLFRWAGVKIGNNCEIFQGCKIEGVGEVIIGDNVFIGMGATIMSNAGSKVIIEDYALVGHYSIIVTGFHPITPEGPRIIGYEGLSSEVKICRGASLGMRATLLPGKTLGEMSHAAACSLITHDVEPYTRVGGVPAQVMKRFIVEK
jgi:putative colanic acid biosynthesis acetyltransferase WcaF